MENLPEILIMDDDQNKMSALYEENLDYFNELIHSQKMANIIALTGEIAHKINNLMGAVMGYASMLQISISSDKPAYEYIQVLMEASEKIADLTKSLLDCSRAGRGDLSKVNLNSLLERMVKLYKNKYKTKTVVKLEISGDKLDVYGSQNMILLALANIFVNAQAAIPDDGVITITASKEKLPEDYNFGRPNSKNLNYAVISIIYNGPGVDDDVLERITANQILNDEISLSATCCIIQKYEGAISVDSESGDESKFMIYLPLVQGD